MMGETELKFLGRLISSIYLRIKIFDINILWENSILLVTVQFKYIEKHD